MPNTRPPCIPEFRRWLIELVRKGRTPEEAGRLLDEVRWATPTARQPAVEVGRRSWLEEAGPPLLILGSALTAPLFTAGGITLTGDRLLGLAALGVFARLGAAGRLHWTPVHSALGAFVSTQVVATALNAAAWPQGLKFVTVYLLGFACFCVAAELARNAEGQRRFATWWIAVGAGLGLMGMILAIRANLTQQLVWGSGLAQRHLIAPENQRLVFAGQATFGEWNLFSSFLLIPFALALWPGQPSAGSRATPWRTLSMAALVFGLAFGFTRAVWLSMAGLIGLWWRLRRPRWRQLAALASMLALAFLLQGGVQAVALGTSYRALATVDPVKMRYNSNLRDRLAISNATIESWLRRPLLGHGAGSINQLSAVLPKRARIEKIWNGNFVLFVLHDSGLCGLAALLGFAVTVCRRGARAVRRAATPSLAVPLLAVGAALCFAYQFTHGLWLMYPYVYLGLLTGATDDAPPV
jgi:O-antigen ligase